MTSQPSPAIATPNPSSPSRIASVASVIARTATFAGLDDATGLDMAKASVRRRLRAGKVVARSGDRDDRLVLVLSGRVDIVRSTDASDVWLRSLYPGGLAGLSVVAGAPHSADLVDGEDSEILMARLEKRGLLRRHRGRIALL